MNGDTLSFLGGRLPSACWGCSCLAAGRISSAHGWRRPTWCWRAIRWRRSWGGNLARVVNLALCVGLAFWPDDGAGGRSTASLLVAAHNFHLAWLMRSMGEEAFPALVHGAVGGKPPAALCACASWAKRARPRLVGAGLVYWSDGESSGVCHRLRHCGLRLYRAVLHLAFLVASAPQSRDNGRKREYESRTPAQLNIEPRKDEFLKLAAQGNLIPVTRRILADFETPLSAYHKIRGPGRIVSV